MIPKSLTDSVGVITLPLIYCSTLHSSGRDLNAAELQISVIPVRTWCNPNEILV